MLLNPQHLLVRNKNLIDVLMAVSPLTNSPSHPQALSVLVHFTRFRDSAKSVVFDNRWFISIVANGTSSLNKIAQRSSVRSIQNISANRSCRPHVLPNTIGLVERLCKIALGKMCADEADPAVRHSAVGALKNLAEEPSNLLPMQKVTDCLPTLIHISHGTAEEGVTPAMALMAKDALANFSDFYQRIVMEAARKQEGLVPGRVRDIEKCDDVLRKPSIQPIWYRQWQ